MQGKSVKSWENIENAEGNEEYYNQALHVD